MSDTTVARIVSQLGNQVRVATRRVGTTILTAHSDTATGTARLVVLESYNPPRAPVDYVRMGWSLRRAPVGDTALFAVHVGAADPRADLNPLLNLPLTVTLSDTTIARVVPGEYPHDLRLLALRNGTTTVTVTVDGKSDCAQLLVADSMPDEPTLCTARVPVAYVRLSSDMAGQVGDSGFVDGWPFEARGWSLPNRIATWSVGDTAIAQARRVKNEDHIYPRGLVHLRRAGSTTLVVTIEGATVSIPVTVR